MARGMVPARVELTQQFGPTDDAAQHTAAIFSSYRKTERVEIMATRFVATNAIEGVSQSVHRDHDRTTVTGSDLTEIITVRTYSNNLVEYSLSNTRVVIDLTKNPQHGGFAEGDTLIDFGNVVGSAFNDVIRGSISFLLVTSTLFSTTLAATYYWDLTGMTSSKAAAAAISSRAAQASIRQVTNYLGPL